MSARSKSWRTTDINSYIRRFCNNDLFFRHERGECEFDSQPVSDNMCSYAHSSDELKEWQVRKQYVINRVQKARDDRLIAHSHPMDNLLSRKPHA